MSRSRLKIRSAVRRDRAEGYLLLSLVAFAATVIVTRVFLELSGYPQIGNSVLHIAHALWGGLLLFIGALLPLALANRWALTVSAIAGGMGIGLFIDEVGKFITQSNDYFFPPALSIIYGFFLLTVVVYLHFRRPQPTDPRRALYHVLDGLHDALDGDLDTREATHIRAQLAIARDSDRGDIASLAEAIGRFLREEEEHLPAAKPVYWRRVVRKIDGFGRRVGRRVHRVAISALLVLWLAFVAGYIVLLARGGANLDSRVVQWRVPLIAIQALVGALTAAAAVAWLAKREELGLNLAVGGFLVSLVALQTLYFYLSQFSALASTLVQVFFVQILFAYRRWYLRQDVS